MSENPETKDKQNPPANESWKEVGQEFEVLGSSLAQAVRTAWSNIHTNSEAQQFKTSFEVMVREVGKAIEDTAATPEGQKVKESAKRAAETLRTAGGKTLDETRPQILAALQKANEEFKKLLDKLAENEKPKTE